MTILITEPPTLQPRPDYSESPTSICSKCGGRGKVLTAWDVLDSERRIAPIIQAQLQCTSCEFTWFTESRYAHPYYSHRVIEPEELRGVLHLNDCTDFGAEVWRNLEKAISCGYCGKLTTIDSQFNCEVCGRILCSERRCKDHFLTP